MAGESHLAERLAPHRLALLGAFAQTAADDTLPKGTRSLALIGPAEGFWPHLQAQSEWQDGQADPIDRWSRRVIGRLACDLGAKALFPFGGPPWHPFHAWALRTGHLWDSPVRLLVHAERGLWASFRGALALPFALDLPPLSRPCDICAAKPCLTSCPAGALGAGGYDVPACHAWLDTTEGQPCLSGGCLVRRACPVSQGHARMAEQSAYHMRQFHR